jgi:hypothetical protein
MTKPHLLIIPKMDGPDCHRQHLFLIWKEERGKGGGRSVSLSGEGCPAEEEKEGEAGNVETLFVFVSRRREKERG